MKNIEILKWQIISFFVVSILGTLLHFLYEWTGNNSVVALFAPVNESTWEHLKLVFFPMLFFNIIEYFALKNVSSEFIRAKTLGVLVAMSFIVIFFYTYTGIIGKSIDIVNIISFFVAVFLGEFVAYIFMKYGMGEVSNKKYLFVWLVLMLLFWTFTYYPLKINLFKDPISGKYGIFRNNG